MSTQSGHGGHGGGGGGRGSRGAWGYGPWGYLWGRDFDDEPQQQQQVVVVYPDHAESVQPQPFVRNKARMVAPGFDLMTGMPLPPEQPGIL